MNVCFKICIRLGTLLGDDSVCYHAQGPRVNPSTVKIKKGVKICIDYGMVNQVN
jgi:hypothetical protein